MTDISQANDGATTQGGGTTADKFKSQIASFKSQAGDKARDYAGQGVEKASGALDEAARFLEDTARTIEEKMGPQYGRYGFSAAESVSGFAEQLRGKDVDELVDDVRSFVRKSPAVAIGAAVGLGFVLARLAKAGAGYESNNLGASGSTTSGFGAAMGSSGFTSTGTSTGSGSALGTDMTSAATGSSGGPVGATATTQSANQDSPITPTFPA
jgi:hypothetical protein